MLGKSVSYYLSRFWATTPLYREKIIPLLDNALSVNYVYTDKLASAFNHILDKYQNTSELPIDELRELVKESGYDYVLDLLNNSETELKVLVYLLVMIHQLKGSEEGIRLVLSLFQEEVDPEDTKVTEWWDTLPVGIENTFQLDTVIDLSKVGIDFYEKFKKFITNYVYPELTRLSLSLTARAVVTPIVYSKMKVVYKNVAREQTV